MVLTLSTLEIGPLQGYFDESGTHAGSPAIAVAGYISTVEQWSEFTVEWKEALDEFGMPDSAAFHMTDFVNRRKHFKGWTEEERRGRLARLIQIINRHVIASIAIVIPGAAYAAVMSDKAKRITGGAYGLAATACFMDAAALLEPTFPTVRIAYAFESGAKGIGQIMKVFQENFNDPVQRAKLKLGGLTLAGKEVAPLQAADILAYEMFKHLPRQLGVESRRPRLESLRPLSVPLHKWGHLEEDELRKWDSLLIHSPL
ncbi:MAG TPA: hypothetical protein VF615_19430 [Longimicrobiaceae bacterium]